MKRLEQKFSNRWHIAINRFMSEPDAFDQYRWMYEAKSMADEVPRMVMLFAMERKGELPKIHRQCSHSEPEEIEGNHLKCCLGVKCSECLALTALESDELTPEQIDIAKAWTCAAHIVSEGGDKALEGYILRVDDRMYWDAVYKNLAAGQP